MIKRVCNIRDIADYVNVAPSTVSRVLNNRPSNIPITEETKKKILEACEKLNYYPNIHARRLFTNSSRTIGLIIPPQARIVPGQHTFADFSLAEMLSGIEEIVSANGYRLLVLVGDRHFVGSKEYLRLFREKSIDGMLVWGLRLGEDYIMDLYGENKPFILVNSYLKNNENVNHIINNDEGGSFKVTEHLIKLRHKKIAYIRGIENVSISIDRERGYRRALNEYGLTPDENFMETGDYSVKSGYKSMMNILKRASGGLTAVVAGNDQMAIGAMRAITEQGLRIPDDIAVAGGDDILLSRYVAPGLTTFRVPMYELGIKAVESLVKIIEGRQKKPVKKILKTKLIIRESTKGKKKEIENDF